MDKHIVFKNSTIYYKVEGDGPVVVLIHGVPADSNLWNNQVPVLVDYKLIIPDLPGSGRSDLPAETSIDSMAECIKAILDAEAVSEAIMIGHSMGGYITLAFAEEYPSNIKALGLFHSTAYADNEEKKKSRLKNIGFIEKHGSYEFMKQSTPGLFSDTFKKDNGQVVEDMIEKYRDFNKASLATYQQAMMERSDRRHLLKELDKPFLFIIGEHDKAVSFPDSMEQCHIPALSYIHILGNSAHMGMIEEAEKSNGIIQNFLKDIYT